MATDDRRAGASDRLVGVYVGTDPSEVRVHYHPDLEEAEKFQRRWLLGYAIESRVLRDRRLDPGFGFAVLPDVSQWAVGLPMAVYQAIKVALGDL